VNTLETAKPRWNHPSGFRVNLKPPKTADCFLAQSPPDKVSTGWLTALGQKRLKSYGED
jgi:hypothetical protein